MRILLVHNFYGSQAPSGENTAYLAERDLLFDFGHEVLEFIRYSDEIRGRGALGTLIGALATPWNPVAAGNLRRLIEQEQPDVMHVHNTFPLISPAVFHAAAGSDTATVLTLHNYRLFCAAGIPLRDSRPCTLCLDQKSIVSALRYGCYRDSRVATVPLALMIALHCRLGTWYRCVDAFIALSGFQKKLMADSGLALDAIHVKPHFYSDAPDALPWEEREEKICFAGRLGSEKGIDILLQAWKAWGPDAPLLEIVGEGPLRGSLSGSVKREGLGDRIVFTGQISFEETQRRLSRARLLVLPTRCFEGFPMAVREAFALGVPVAASRIGALTEIVKEGVDGSLFEAGNATDLLMVVRSLWSSQDQLKKMATAARNAFETNYSADVNYAKLMDIYAAAVRRRRERPRRFR
jgi:glycosyltransferase involved in cell wall biosynthesis